MIDFNAILETTQSGRNIVARENHNSETINSGFDAGSYVSDQAKLLESRRSRLDSWDACEMGMTLEEAEAAFAKATTPEELARVEAELTERAQNRASLATIDGKVAVAYTGDAWHELGVQVTEAMTAAEAIKLASLDYQVEKRRVIVDGFGPVSGLWSVGRIDGEQFLPFDGVGVGDRFELLQNHEAFDFIDEVVQSSGAHYSSAGAVGQGQEVFITVELDKVIHPLPGDEVKAYLSFHNWHDGTGAVKAFLTNLRSICRNTARQAINSRGKRSVSIRHTKNMRTKVGEAREVLLGATKAFEGFGEVADRMSQTQVNPTHYANDVLDAVLDITAADAAKGADALAASLKVTEAERELESKRFARKIAKRGEVLEDILNRHESETNRNASGTLWGAYNAVTEYANHGLAYRGGARKRAESRLSSILDGRADAINQAAYNEAVEVLDW